MRGLHLGEQLLVLRKVRLGLRQLGLGSAYLGGELRFSWTLVKIPTGGQLFHGCVHLSRRFTKWLLTCVDRMLEVQYRTLQLYFE